MIFNKIGLAITFSPNGLALLKTAKRLQNLFNSDLCLIHVGDKEPDSELKMKKLLDEVGIDGTKSELVWKKGEPSKIILSVCAEKDVDLLIAGALEKENLLKYYIGSVARTLMRESPCSVLIITHPTQDAAHFRKFCATVEYTSLGEISLTTANEFAKLEHAEELTLIKEFQIPGLAITISDSGSTTETEQKRIAWQKEEEEKLNVFVKELKLTGNEIKTICLYGKHGWESGNYVKEINGDILVIPSPPKKLKLFDRIFQHDIEFIIKQLPCSLLIVKK